MGNAGSAAGSAVSTAGSAVGSAGSAAGSAIKKIPVPGVPKGEPKYKSYLDTVGKTVSTHRASTPTLTHRASTPTLPPESRNPRPPQPLVKLDRMLPDAAKHATVLVKLEMQNPGGSIKDRIALVSLARDRKHGVVQP